MSADAPLAVLSPLLLCQQIHLSLLSLIPSLTFHSEPEAIHVKTSTHAQMTRREITKYGFCVDCSSPSKEKGDGGVCEGGRVVGSVRGVEGTDTI